MISIPAQEIKRRGISVVDELLQNGPVQVIRYNRPRYVVMSIDTYERINQRRPQVHRSTGRAPKATSAQSR